MECPESARWVIEFLLLSRKPIVPTKLLKNVITKIPLSAFDSRLKKTLLLRTLLDLLHDLSVTDPVLQILEILEELNLRDSAPVTTSMAAAYCAVAVDCTLKFLLLDPHGHNPGYLAAADRIWRARVPHMKGSLLFSPELERWRSDIEASISDLHLREKLSSIDTRREAIFKLRDYLDEEWANLGPSFLELAAMKITIHGREIENCAADADGVHPLTNVEDQKVGECGSGELQKLDEASQLDSLAVNEEAPIESRDADVPCPHFINNSEADLMEKNQTSAEEMHPLTTVEVQKVIECGSVELQKLAIDSLLNSLEVNEVAPIESRDADLPCARVIDDKEPDVMEKDQTSIPRNPGHKPSLREGNTTARIYEWADSIASLEDGTSDHATTVNLPRSPRRTQVSPLKKYKAAGITRRRKVKKWSLLEEETLKTAVDKYGRGNWKFILDSHRDIFEERTEVDLKDKWRNMMQ